MERVDCIVAGAGVVGLAVARELAMSGREVLVLEAQDAVGTQASSRNSEVLHAGIYYPRGSLKARLCVAGRGLLYAYCAARGIQHNRTGKIIVATEQAQVRDLERYKAQANANGVDDLAWLSSSQVLGFEPEVRCVCALYSPSTGIVDSRALLLALQADVEAAGGTVVLGTAVHAVRQAGAGFEVEAAGTRVVCRQFVNSAGLQASELARRIEGLPPERIPATYLARGHYFALQGRAPFRHLVYPVAEKAGLGIHVTLDLGGAARFGPDVQWIDTIDYRFDESRRAAFAAAIRRYYPALDESRLVPAYTGIRAKIAGPGEPPADFIVQGPGAHGIAGLVNLFGIESPGLTACLAIAQAVALALSAQAP